MSRFDLSEIQAQAILDLRLRALTGARAQAGRGRVRRPARSGSRSCARSSATPARIDALIREELLEIKEIYGRNDDRRTEIVAAEGELELEDLIAEEDMVIAITRSGYIKRLPVSDLPRAAPRRHRRHGHGPQGRRLHRAPVRRLDARLPPLLHLRRQGLPAEGARAAARLAPVEGPRDRQPAAVSPGRAGARRRADARLQGGRVPRLRDEEGRRQEDRASPTTTRRSRPTGSSRSRCARTTSSSASATRRATTTCCWSRARARRSASTRATSRPMGRATAGVQGMGCARATR